MNDHPYAALDPRPKRGGAILTNAELDSIVKSLRAVGSPYDFIADHVEHANRPRCVD